MLFRSIRSIILAMVVLVAVVSNAEAKKRPVKAAKPVLVAKAPAEYHGHAKRLADVVAGVAFALAALNLLYATREVVEQTLAGTATRAQA